MHPPFQHSGHSITSGEAGPSLPPQCNTGRLLVSHFYVADKEAETQSGRVPGPRSSPGLLTELTALLSLPPGSQLQPGPTRRCLPLPRRAACATNRKVKTKKQKRRRVPHEGARVLSPSSHHDPRQPDSWGRPLRWTPPGEGKSRDARGGRGWRGHTGPSSNLFPIP